MSKVVVLWTGGVDSTGVLYKILKDFPIDVVAHHIHFKNREKKRWEAEKDAIDTMIPWLRKNVREFEYSESTIEMDLKFIGWDVMTAMYMGGIVARDKKCDRIALGVEKPSSKQIYDHWWRTGMSQLLSIMTSLRHPQKSQSLPVIWQVMSQKTKKEIWDSLPEFLKENTWSCRKPTLNGKKDGKWIECGICKSCEQLNDVKEV